MDLKNGLPVAATLVSNDFIDHYMASANGEYVKEYLFLLRHRDRDVTVSMIADALNHTESDVTRALAYWKRSGVLAEAGREMRLLTEAESGGAESGGAESDGGESTKAMPKGAACAETACSGSMAAEGSSLSAVRGMAESGLPAAPKSRPAYPPERIGSLAGDEDFSQLLYIAQKYMNKVFTQMECEVFAYLYDGLKMSAELLEYVVEYCVQSGHTSIRYIETVAINWYESGIRTVEEGKAHASSFSKDSFAVMKAFGLNDRKPGDSEWEMIERWFKSYGFTRELVLEACNRTIAATHSPSFKYADKILSGWKKAGVHTPEDVKRLDQQHAGRAKEKGGAVTEGKPSHGGRGRNSNQFQNFPQRDIDYDALVLKQLKET